MITRLIATILMPNNTIPNTQATKMKRGISSQLGSLKGSYTMMNRKAKAAAEVTMIVRLRFVRRYLGMNCEKKFIC